MKKLHDMAYDPVESDFDIAETAEEPSEFIPSNNYGFSHHEPAISSAKQAKCQNVRIAMLRNIKINDLHLVANKGSQV